MQRPRGMRVPPFLHRTELSVFALWWDSWHEPLRPGKGEVGLGSLQTLLDLASLQLADPWATSGVFQCASSSVSRNSALEGGSGRVGENHGFWVLQAARLKACGEGSVRHCHSWWGLGVLGTQGGSCPRSYSLWVLGCHGGLSMASLFSLLSAFLVCMPARPQAWQKPTLQEYIQVREILEEGLRWHLNE